MKGRVIMSNKSKDVLTGVNKTLEKIPTIYDDGLKEAVKESGDVLALIPRTVKAALVPLRQWIANREYNLAETEKLLTQKLEKVDVNKITTPEAYVAVPAFQSISYSMGNDNLRNLYANLLAKSMNRDTKDLVHPSFVEIIKQMSPLDAVIFKSIMEVDVRPLITITRRTPNDGEFIVQEYCSWISNFSLKQCATSFNNLIRLRLIEIPYDKSYEHKSHYDVVKQNPLFQSLKYSASESLSNDDYLYFNKQYIKTNELSNLFFTVCVKDF